MTLPAPLLFVGLGRLGLPLAQALLRGGVDMLGWDADEDARARWQAGGGVCAEPAQLDRPSGSDVFLCLPTPQAAAQWLARWEQAPRGLAPALVVDLGTTPPSVSCAHAVRVAAWGGEMLDAPTTRRVGEHAGGVTVLVGGQRAAFERVRPYLSMLGAAQYLGPTGSGSRMKAVVQFVYLSYNAAFGLGVRLAQDQGLPPDAVLETLRQGASGHELIERRLRDLTSGTGPERFMIWRALKDLAGIEDREQASPLALAWLERLEDTLSHAGELVSKDADLLTALSGSLGLEQSTGSEPLNDFAQKQ
jgi:3-hydroxyisobutyrate dehydrogenase-like beta-hydroxyacid dehydrogenase